MGARREGGSGAVEPIQDGAATGAAGRASASAAGVVFREWAELGQERPAGKTGWLSGAAQDVLRAVALGSTLGVLAWGGLRLGRAMLQSSAVATTSSAVAPLAPPVSASSAASMEAPATATAAGNGCTGGDGDRDGCTELPL